MARFCTLCSRSFPTTRAYICHRRNVHRHPKPQPTPTAKHFHPLLTARPCNAQGDFLPPGAPPAPKEGAQDFGPFCDRPSFEFAELVFEKMQVSKADLNQLLHILAAKNVVDGHANHPAIFENADELLETIDAIPFGDTVWRAYKVRYTGAMGPDSPSWMRKTYVIYLRNSLVVAEQLAASEDFDGKFDTRPVAEYNADGDRVYCNFMSGQWAHNEAISEDPNTHGAMLVPIILGADKTTVSVATGHQEYHPVYMSIGNIQNDMRRAHRDSVVPVAFLAIPKADREEADTEAFRIFKKKLYHTSLVHLLEPLRAGMTAPHILRCPDGHFRRAIFDIGPFIADYPEQVYLSGIVSGWCPKCRAFPEDLSHEGPPRFREHTEMLHETFDDNILWDVFGLIRDVKLFTYYFPRADIHDLLSPDILHQLVKGTFKDHVVSWVEDYIKLTAESEREASRILDDIDRRLAAVPPFPGLRRFPQGRNFKQWTGNDSKALMKIYLPAIAGYVPDQMVQCIAALLDFAYLARRSSHTGATLGAMNDILGHFHNLRTIFEEVGVRPEGFSLPRQHSLVHYVRSIKLFGSPNGLCSSITESKHIDAVKRPWRASNRRDAIGQILRTLTRCSKMAAARVEFGRRGMLRGDVFTAALRTAGHDIESDDEEEEDEVFHATERIYILAETLHIPRLHEYMRRFLYDQLEPNAPVAGDIVNIEQCPEISPLTSISVYRHAKATFYAPSELAGPNGMHREIIRCNPRWYGDKARYDTVLVETDSDAIGLEASTVARLRACIAFTYQNVRYECALVEWFEGDGDAPDPATGMWVVRPELDAAGERVWGIIHIDSIIRACHLVGVYGRTALPTDFDYTDSLDAFRRFYVNWYADYHSHEILV
ncbi:hypothetical protein BD309DRAFT_993112 [Dichomitus squalens]|nr:hypothetical protein BD309DRAFT_993112 [Dichomitus squalens]